LNEILRIDNVWKKFKGNWVLKGITFSVKENSVIALVGKNGSGKTTLLKIMCGLVKPTKGKVEILGEDVHRGDGNYKWKIGVLLHENILYEELTVGENLKYYARIYGQKDLGGIASEVFERLGLDRYSSTKVGHLSYGWRKRVNLVRALINDPELILLDEPLSGLDEEAEKIVSEIIVDLSKEKTVLFTIPNKYDLASLLKSIDAKVVELVDGGLKFE